MRDIVKKAFEFAQKKHEGQFRLYSHLPYFSHPKYVSEIIEQLTDDEILIAAALLHDVVEDTDTSLSEIEKLFGEDIAFLVDELTNKPEEMENRKKKDYMYEKIRNMSSPAFTIKLADRFHNVIFLEQDCKSGDQFSFFKWYYENTVYILDGIEYERKMNNAQKELLDRIQAVLDFLRIKYDF